MLFRYVTWHGKSLAHSNQKKTTHAKFIQTTGNKDNLRCAVLLISETTTGNLGLHNFSQSPE